MLSNKDLDIEEVLQFIKDQEAKLGRDNCKGFYEINIQQDFLAKSGKTLQDIFFLSDEIAALFT